MRLTRATWVGTTDHSNPHRVQVKYKSSDVTTVTIGGACKWQRGHVPNGAGPGLGALGRRHIAHARTEVLGAVMGTMSLAGVWPRWFVKR